MTEAVIGTPYMYHLNPIDEFREIFLMKNNWDKVGEIQHYSFSEVFSKHIMENAVYRLILTHFLVWSLGFIFKKLP